MAELDRHWFNEPVVLQELPCAGYTRAQADGVAYRLRQQLGSGVTCSGVTTAQGRPVWRISYRYETGG